MQLPLLVAMSLALPALTAPTPTPKDNPTAVSHTGILTLPADHKPFHPLIDGPLVDQLMEVPAPEPTKHCMKVPAVTFCDLTLGIFCTNYGRKPGECVEAQDRKGKPSIEGRDVVPSKRDVVPPPPQRTGSSLIDWDDGTLGPKELPSIVKRDAVPPPPHRTGSSLINWDDGTLGPKELPSMKLVKRPYLLPSERPSLEPKVELDDRTHEEKYFPVKGDGISHMPVVDSPVKRSPLLPPPYRENESADQEHKVWNPAKGLSGMMPAVDSPVKRSFLLPSERPPPGPKVEVNDCTHEESDPPVKANGMSYMPVEKREKEKSWWSRNVGSWFDEDW
jgi:hypothetical protein